MTISNEQINTLFQHLGATKQGINDIKERMDRDARERRERQERLDETLTLIREDHTELNTRVLKLESTEQRNKGFVKGVSFVVTMLIAGIAWLIDLVMKLKGN